MLRCLAVFLGNGFGGTDQVIDFDGALISSPNYPHDYPNYHDCSNLIKLGKEQRIRLVVLDFEVGYNRPNW